VIQFLQQQLAQVGIRVRVQALEAGQRVERVESVQRPEDAGVRLYYVGWSSSTGEADWALRPLLASESWPPRLFNVAYYRNEQVDAAINRALATTDPNDKAAAYREAQERIWKDAPWAFLVTEKLLYARSKSLSGVHVLPDAAFDFVEAELK
jgi:glutathione transport system substrate-binding protein